MTGPPRTYVGIDLGGARGRTTAVARLRRLGDGVTVEAVGTRHDELPWTDDVLCDHLAGEAGSVVVAINAPLTMPACVRCTLSACPGAGECVDPAVVWLREEGQRLLEAAAEDRESIAAVPAGIGHATRPLVIARAPRLAPYLHRCCEVDLHFERNLIPRSKLGKSAGPIAARGAHLRRRLETSGFALNQTLLEVSPRATICALFGEARARGYKRDADPWETRAAIVEQLVDLSFAPTSRLSREEVLRNDHCFEALLSGYTAYLAHREHWVMRQDEAFAEDGWIWAPPPRP